MRADDYEAIRQGTDVWNDYRKTQKASDPSWVADLAGADLAGANLTSANLTGADLAGANLHRTDLIDADLAGANLTGANLIGADLAVAHLHRTDLIGANLDYANLNGAYLITTRLIGANLDFANLNGAYLIRADLTDAILTRANLTRADLTDAILTRAILNQTALADVDVSAFCAAEELTHAGPSSIDARTVMRSFTHPRIKEFMADCGVPWLFAEYMVDCAKAETTQDLKALMQSTFISYGQPDDAFARRLYESMTAKRITVFYFPETARWGERLSNEVHTQLNSHDRVILICSKGSLNRPGVRNEIQETFDREAREGGATYLLPLVLDDYLFDPKGWERVEPELARRVRARIAGDFRKAQTDPTEYDHALNRLIDVLKKTKP